MRSLAVAILLCLTGLTLCSQPPDGLEPTPQSLPPWRGFNLQERFICRKNSRPFQEWDFKTIADLGFNFVRLPLDYRFWIRNGNWKDIDHDALREIDRALELGRKYNLHVCLNFHRAPGYTVAKPPETMSLWSSPEAQQVCALHWRTFARRYRHIPNRDLSFNLFNEPPDIPEDAYLRVVNIMLQAIREESPNRLVICDGLGWGNTPCQKLIPLQVAQATRGYKPMELTHYKASWVTLQDTPKPSWPVAFAWLAGNQKKNLKTPILITTDFKESALFKVTVGIVSQNITLKATANGNTVWTQHLPTGPGQGPWEKAVYNEQWKIYQNPYNRTYCIQLPAGTRQVRLEATDGDWCTIRQLAFQQPGQQEVPIQTLSSFGLRNMPLTFRNGQWLQNRQTLGRQWLDKQVYEPWARLKKQQVGVMVGEFGCHNRTPHDVTLRWMEDCLAVWKKHDIPWALWNFRGSFGIFDSGRKDVRYEPYQGHLLDRKMLELLQKYR